DFREGHDRIGALVRLTAPAGTEGLHRLSALEDGTDRWQAEIALDLQGTWHYRFDAFGDALATWAHDAAVKLAAGIDVAVMTALGQRLFARAADERARPAAERRLLASTAEKLSHADADTALAITADVEIAELFAARPLFSLS